jgi:hypothetical protein
MKMLSKILFSPALLFFLFGMFVRWVTNKEVFSPTVRKCLSLYLLIAIGLKGGVLISENSEGALLIIGIFAAALILAFCQPFLGNWLLKKTTKLDKVTAAALASHYGSISLVTFIAAMSFLDQHQITYKPYMTSLMALMEVPAIFSGIFLIKKHEMTKNNEKIPFGSLIMQETPLLLLGGNLIGMLLGKTGFEPISGFFTTPFQGALALFLFCMGELVAANKEDIKLFKPSLLLFGIYMPIIGSIFSLLIIKLFGLDFGSAFLCMVLFASASYIAVPASMQIIAPNAKSAVFVPMTLGISFPFNLLIGFFIYYHLIKWIL